MRFTENDATRMSLRLREIARWGICFVSTESTVPIIILVKVLATVLKIISMGLCKRDETPLPVLCLICTGPSVSQFELRIIKKWLLEIIS